MKKERIKWKLCEMLVKALWIFPIKKNKIVFMSNLGKQCACNPYYIAKELENVEGLDIVWIYDNGDAFTKNSRTVHQATLRALYEQATARVWVDNCRKPIWMRKRKGQYYIQTWHGGVAMKKVEKDALEALPYYYEEQGRNDSSMADLFLAASNWNIQNYREVFWYDGEILESGLPRTDIFFNEPTEYIKKVKSFYGIEDDVHFVVYAPTFRVDHNIDCYGLDFYRVKKALEETFGGEWKVIVRLHPNVQAKQSFISYDQNILNGSKYSEMNELIMASDVLITDYSSCMFDAMLSNKKVLLFATDYEAYKQDRGGYFDLDELPFNFCTSNESIIDVIKSFDERAYRELIEAFTQKLGFYEKGTASKQVANRILQEMGLEVKKPEKDI